MKFVYDVTERACPAVSLAQSDSVGVLGVYRDTVSVHCDSGWEVNSTTLDTFNITCNSSGQWVDIQECVSK